MNQSTVLTRCTFLETAAAEPNCEDLVVESGVCGAASEFNIAGTGVFVYTRWLERARGLPPPSVGTQAESKAEVSGSRAETRKAVKRSSNVVVAVFKCARFSAHPP